ncbi:MAG: cytochrome b/b6 domain-containing protein, partial [Planctomycetota bacterium]|nr:cytochrome b/b6 domain-containing protein [Planctomycetota bacterium]
LTLAILIAMRITWGFIGSRYARFGSFLFSPSAVLGYMGGFFTGKSTRHIGHNPGSAVAIFAMLALILGVAATGFMLGRGDERFEDLHAILAYATMAVAGIHILGVIVHTIVHREQITLSMIDGKKSALASDAILSPRPAVALAGLTIAVLWAFGLINNLDAAAQRTTLPLTNLAVQIGESDQPGLEKPNRSQQTEADDD